MPYPGESIFITEIEQNAPCRISSPTKILCYSFEEETPKNSISIKKLVFIVARFVYCSVFTSWTNDGQACAWTVESTASITIVVIPPNIRCLFPSLLFCRGECELRMFCFHFYYRIYRQRLRKWLVGVCLQHRHRTFHMDCVHCLRDFFRRFELTIITNERCRNWKWSSAHK